MTGMRILSRASGSQPRFSEKALSFFILEIDSWMPSNIQAISPLVDRLMRLIEGSHCVRETSSVSSWRYAKLWEMPSFMAIRKIQKKKFTSAAAVAWRGNIHRRDGSGKGFDLGKVVGDGFTSDSAARMSTASS